MGTTTSKKNRPQTQQKSPKLSESAKEQNTERTKKENPLCDGLNHRKDRSRVSPVPQGARLGAKVGSCKIAIKVGIHHHRGYSVRQSARFIERTRRPQTNLRR